MLTVCARLVCEPRARSRFGGGGAVVRNDFNESLRLEYREKARAMFYRGYDARVRGVAFTFTRRTPRFGRRVTPGNAGT